MSRLLFWMLTALYAYLYYHKASGNYWPITSDYLADLICLPIVLSICRTTLIKWRFVAPTFELTGSMIFVAVVYFSVVFEGLLPLWKSNYQADILDILAYLLGGILYFLYRLHIQTKRYDPTTT